MGPCSPMRPPAVPRRLRDGTVLGPNRSKDCPVDMVGYYDYDDAMLVHHGLVVLVPVRMFGVGGGSIDIT